MRGEGGIEDTMVTTPHGIQSTRIWASYVVGMCCHLVHGMASLAGHGMLSQRSVSMLLLHVVASQAIAATVILPGKPRRLMAAVSKLEEGAMQEVKQDVVEKKTASARKKKSGSKVRTCRTADWV